MYKKIIKLTNFLNKDGGSLRKKALRSGIWLGISGVVINFLTLGRSIVLARLLTPDIFGLMSLALIVFRSIETFTRPGIVDALIHRQEDFEEGKDTAFVILVVRGILLALVIVAAAPFIAKFYDQEDLTLMLIIMSLSFIINGFVNVSIVARIKNIDFKNIAYLDQLLEFSNTVIIIILAFYFRNIWALVVAHVLSAVAYVLLSYTLIPGRMSFKFNLKLAKELFKYGKFITGISIVLYFSSQLDNAFIGKILGIEQLGYYVLAFTTANYATTYISKLSSRILFPVYSKIQDDVEKVRNIFLQIFELIILIVLPMATGLALLAVEVMPLVYGEKWLPSAEPLKILCIFGVARSVVSLIGYLMNGLGKPQYDFYLAIGRTILILILIYPMTVEYGLDGAAWSITIPMTLQCIIGFLVLRKFISLELRKFALVLIQIVAKTGLMAAVVIVGKYYFDLTNPLILSATILLAMIVYAVLNYSVVIRLLHAND